MKKLPLLAFILGLSTSASLAGGIISFKDSEEFNSMQDELRKLKQSHSNPALDKLWEDANRIAELNSKCGTISLTDVLDESCGNFFRVELPAFESRFMEVTGQVRIGSIQLQKDVRQKATQITACLDAMASLYVAKGLMTSLEGGVVNMEPLDKYGNSFEVEYDFNVSFDKDKVEIVRNLGQFWIDKCGDIVMNRGDIVPLFRNSLEAFNDSIAKASDIDVFAFIDKDKIVFDERHDLGGNYYLGDQVIFSSKGIPSGAYLLLNLSKKKAFFPSRSASFSKNFSGKRQYSGVNDMTGRWVINSRLGEIRRQKRIAEQERQAKRLNEQKRLEKIEKKLGRLEDSRDGQVYRTIRVGHKNWMAENLNYKTKDDSFCYNQKTSNCQKYGRLYSYAAAKNACPSGWHLPNTVEFGKLLKATQEPAAQNLLESESLLFRAELAGYIDNTGYPKAMGQEARFWTSTEYGDRRAYYFLITPSEVDTKHNQKFGGFSVRCVQDE